MALDWQVGESKDQGLSEPSEKAFEMGARPTDTAGRRWRLHRVLLSAVLTALLTLIAVGFYYWQYYQDGLTRIRTDIQSTIDLEAWALSTPVTRV